MRWHLTTRITKWLYQLLPHSSVTEQNTTHTNTNGIITFRQHLAHYMPIIRLMLLVIVIFLSYQAHQIFMYKRSPNGFIPLSIAAILFVIATWTISLRVQPTPSPQIEKSLLHGWSRLLGIFWLAISAVFL